MNLEDKIDKYLLNNMNAEETADFESEISADTELLRKVEAKKELILAFDTYELKQKMKGIIAEAENTDQVEATEAKVVELKRSRRRWLSIAASLTILVMAGWFTLNRDVGSIGADTSLYADFFVEDPGLPTPMSSTNKYEFYDAMVDYKSEDYMEAYNKWTLLDLDNINDTIIYYRSMALLNQKNMKEAGLLLKRIPSESVWNNKAKWYSALIMMDTGQKDEALKILKELDINEFELKDELIDKLNSH